MTELKNLVEQAEAHVLLLGLLLLLNRGRGRGSVATAGSRGSAAATAAAAATAEGLELLATLGDERLGVLAGDLAVEGGEVSVIDRDTSGLKNLLDVGRGGRGVSTELGEHVSSSVPHV